MSDPKLHHYVPRFYLRRFCDAAGHIWAWDKKTDRVFPTSPQSVAAEHSFYYVDQLAERGRDPLMLERHFASLETEMSRATSQWLECIRGGSLGMRLPISAYERAVAALFIALQFCRTADTRELLVQFASLKGGTVVSDKGHAVVSEHMRRLIHTNALWNGSVLEEFRRRLESAFWIFARNTTEIPFVTSDNPVAFRRFDHGAWVKIGQFCSGTVVVYPLAPDVILYCYPREDPWLILEPYDSSTSTIAFTDKMAATENTAQPFMASRFVFSPEDDFAPVKEYARMIERPTVHVPFRGS